MTKLSSFLLGVIFAGTILGMHIEIREAQVEARIQQARIDAARQAMRVSQCTWKDLFVVRQ